MKLTVAPAAPAVRALFCARRLPFHGRRAHQPPEEGAAMTRKDENGRRHKTGGRRKGSVNKSTAAIKEAMLAVFAELQEQTGTENGHFLEWAKGNSTDFYKLASKLLPLQVTGGDGGPIVTRIELVAPNLPLPRDDGAVS
jgi:hypothetical protein